MRKIRSALQQQQQGRFSALEIPYDTSNSERQAIVISLECVQCLGKESAFCSSLRIEEGREREKKKSHRVDR